MNNLTKTMTLLCVASLVACGTPASDNNPPKAGDSPKEDLKPSIPAPKPVVPKPVEPKPVEPKPVEPKPVEPKPDNNAKLTIQEGAKGYCGAVGVIDTKHTGYVGQGFVDVENLAGASIDWQINASESNVYKVTIRYANGSTSARSGTLTSNGNAGASADFNLGGTGAWASWADETVDISLNAGVNKLKLSADGGEGLANIDSIAISGPAVSAETCEVAPPSTGNPSNPSNPGNPSVPVIDIPKDGTSQPKMSAKQWVGYGPAPTGGAGGKTVTVSSGKGLHDALCGRSTDTTPLTIKVNGTINHGNTSSGKGSCNGTKADTIVLKEVKNITIEGVGTRGVFDQVGIQISKSSNIIIRNVTIKNVKKSGSPKSNGGDAIAIQGGPQTRIWIDHNTLEASGGEKDGYDSLIDMKNDSTHITVSYNHFRNSSRGGLIGASDGPDGNNYFVFHHNFYENIEQRTPLLRRATIHSFNNYWENKSSVKQIHYINARDNGKALVENNYFKNVTNPIIASTDSDVSGCWSAKGNAWEGGTYTRTPENGKAHKVPVNWKSGDLNGNNCNVSGAKSVNLDKAGDVPAIVKANAGVGKT